jgi:hypothetical protein
VVAALTAATTEKTKHLSASRDGNRDWMREAASQGMSLPATTEDASMKHTSLSSFMFILLQARPTGARALATPEPCKRMYVTALVQASAHLPMTPCTS